MKKWLVAIAAAAYAIAACSSSDAPDDDAGASPGVPSATFDADVTCARSSDCPIGLVCAYAIADGCGARGACIYGDCLEDPNCPPVPAAPACGCDGANVAYVTSAYAAAPVRSPSACGADADADANADANADADAHASAD